MLFLFCFVLNWLEYENSMMFSYLSIHKVVEGFIGFLGYYLSVFMLYLLMVETLRNPPFQRCF